MMLTKRALLTLLVASAFCLTACQSSSDAPPNSTNADKPMAGNTSNGSDDVAVAEASAPCALVMGWDPWEPYHFEGSDGETRGMDVDFAAAMAERAGCTIRFEQGEWAQLLKAMQADRIDLLAGATKVDQREPFAWFSEPYRAESFQLHVANDSEVQGNDLFVLIEAGFRLGLTEGYIYGDAITALQDNPLSAQKIVYSPIAEYHFNNLAEGRIDGFLEDPYVAEAIARRHGWQEQVRALPISFGSHEVRFMFNRSTVDEELLERMNHALLAMQESGLSDEIMQRYLKQ